LSFILLGFVFTRQNNTYPSTFHLLFAMTWNKPSSTQAQHHVSYQEQHQLAQHHSYKSKKTKASASAACTYKKKKQS